MTSHFKRFLVYFIISLMCTLHGHPAMPQGEFLVHIDPVSGTFTKLGGPVPGVNWIVSNNRALDEGNGWFVFKGGVIDPDHLFSVDDNTGSTIYNPPFANGIWEYMFDNTSGTLYGIYSNQATQGFHLVSIDPATGSFSLIDPNPIPGMNGLLQGVNTYDEIHNRFIQLANGNQLFSIDAMSGNVFSAPVLALSTGDGVVHLCFDNSLDRLCGLIWESMTQKYWLIVIDPLDGTFSKIGNGTLYANGNGSSTIDQTDQKYIYVYDDSGNFSISSVDILSGNVTHRPITLDPGDNICCLKFDQSSGRLLGLHWDATMSHTDTYSFRDTMKVNLHQVNGILTISTVRRISTVEIFSMEGRQVFTAAVNHQRAVLNLTMLPSGLYIYRINGEAGIMSTGSLILQ